MALCHPVEVAIAVQVVSTVKQFLDLEFVFLWIADQIVDNSGSLHDDLVIEGAILYVDLLSIPEQVVNLINIDTISRV